MARLEIRHRFLPRRRVTAIMRVLRHARGDRPKPGRVSVGRVRKKDATDVLVAVEHVVIIVRPLAVREVLGGAF